MFNKVQITANILRVEQIEDNILTEVEYRLAMKVDDSRGAIRVTQQMDRNHKVQSPTINWSAYGDVSIDKALEMAKLLKLATTIAGILEANTDEYKISALYVNAAERVL